MIQFLILPIDCSFASLTSNMSVLVTVFYLFYRLLRDNQAMAKAKVIHIWAFKHQIMFFMKNFPNMHSDPINSYGWSILLHFKNAWILLFELMYRYIDNIQG